MLYYTKQFQLLLIELIYLSMIKKYFKNAISHINTNERYLFCFEKFCFKTVYFVLHVLTQFAVFAIL